MKGSYESRRLTKASTAPRRNFSEVSGSSRNQPASDPHSNWCVTLNCNVATACPKQFLNLRSRLFVRLPAAQSEFRHFRTVFHGERPIDSKSPYRLVNPTRSPTHIALIFSNNVRSPFHDYCNFENFEVRCQVSPGAPRAWAWRETHTRAAAHARALTPFKPWLCSPRCGFWHSALYRAVELPFSPPLPPSRRRHHQQRLNTIDRRN